MVPRTMPKFGFFYDYMSLFQFERQTAAQEDSFKRSMENMHVLYSHEFTCTLRIQSLTPEDVWSRMLQSEEGVPVFHVGSGEVKALPLRDLAANPTPYEGHFGSRCVAANAAEACPGMPQFPHFLSTSSTSSWSWRDCCWSPHPSQQ